jgi:hypothetical protein
MAAAVCPIPNTPLGNPVFWINSPTCISVAEQLGSTLEPLTRLVTCADSAAQRILPCSST